MDVLMVMPYRYREALLDGTYTVVGNVLHWQPTGLGSANPSFLELNLQYLWDMHVYTKHYERQKCLIYWVIPITSGRTGLGDSLTT